jgi:hypothetical protein
MSENHIKHKKRPRPIILSSRGVVVAGELDGVGHFVGRRVLDVGKAPADTTGHHFVEILYGGAFSGVRILCEGNGEGSKAW